jgi:hypothetical protein
MGEIQIATYSVVGLCVEMGGWKKNLCLFSPEVD